MIIFVFEGKTADFVVYDKVTRSIVVVICSRIAYMLKIVSKQNNDVIKALNDVHLTTLLRKIQ